MVRADGLTRLSQLAGEISAAIRDLEGRIALGRLRGVTPDLLVETEAMHARLLAHSTALGPTLAAETRARWSLLGVRLRVIRTVVSRGR
jgi:hypothetical protein